MLCMEQSSIEAARLRSVQILDFLNLNTNRLLRVRDYVYLGYQIIDIESLKETLYGL